MASGDKCDLAMANGSFGSSQTSESKMMAIGWQQTGYVLQRSTKSTPPWTILNMFWTSSSHLQDFEVLRSMWFKMIVIVHLVIKSDFVAACLPTTVPNRFPHQRTYSRMHVSLSLSITTLSGHYILFGLYWKGRVAPNSATSRILSKICQREWLAPFLPLWNAKNVC